MTARLFKVMMAPNAAARAAEVLASEWIGCGPRAAAFEGEVQRYLELPHAPIATASGTAALEIAVETLLKPGDFVISSPVTFIATNAVLARAGMRILFGDVDPQTGLLDVEDVARLARAYGDLVRGVVGVDWCGLRTSTTALGQAAPGRAIILDAAQSFGWRRRRFNQLRDAPPDATCWSFQATKHVTTVDGGAVFFKNDRLVEGARALAYFGLDADPDVASERRMAGSDSLGSKRHLDDVRAAIGSANLTHAFEWQSRRDEVACFYAQHVGARPFPPGSAFWVYPARVRDLDEARRAFREEGIETSQVHVSNDQHRGLMPYVENLFDPRPGVDEYRAHFLAVPCGPWLTGEDVERIAGVLAQVQGR